MSAAYCCWLVQLNGKKRLLLMVSDLLPMVCGASAGMLIAGVMSAPAELTGATIERSVWPAATRSAVESRVTEAMSPVSSRDTTSSAA